MEVLNMGKILIGILVICLLGSFGLFAASPIEDAQALVISRNITKNQAYNDMISSQSSMNQKYQEYLDSRQIYLNNRVISNQANSLYNQALSTYNRLVTDLSRIITIQTCSVLNKSGATYKISRNFSATGNCIVITGNYIILNGNNKVITSNGNGIGISMNANYTSISNLTLKNFEMGIYGSRGTVGNSISNVRIE
jgi:hypothetical protein